MIRDVIIIKDGLPLLSKNFSNSGTIFSQGESLLMMSGFFSAINSFSDQFEKLGTVSELRLSKNDLKLSFLRDRNLPNLTYLATFDETSKGVNVQRALRKISRNFLQKYNANQILNWRGRKDKFKDFEEDIEKFVDDEKKEKEIEFKEKVVDLFKNIEEKITEDKNSSIKKEDINIPDYYNHVPASKISKNVNPSYYLTSKKSIKIFKEIDGEKSIDKISNLLSLNQKEVYNICKNLVKLGFIAL